MNMKKNAVVFLIFVFTVSFWLPCSDYIIFSSAMKPVKKVVIDAGHGGNDPGAIGYVVEKEINLEVAILLEEYLKRNYQVEILMTRERDTYLTLIDRATLANAWGADFLFSIHSNAGGGYGYEDFIYTNACDESIRIRDVIHPFIAKVWEDAGRRNRGKKTANFAILRETKMPAMLVELGFVDNQEDALLLQNEDFVRNMAREIGGGIAAALFLPPLYGMDGPVINTNEKWTSAEKVSVLIDSNSNSADLVEYSLFGATNGNWKKYTGSFDIKNEGKTLIMARNVFNDLELISDISIAMVKIDRSGPGKPVIELSDNDWSYDDVVISIYDGLDTGEITDFAWQEKHENDFSTGDLENVIAASSGGLKLDRWEENFEAENSLVLGGLPAKRDMIAAKTGSYGLVTKTEGHGQLLSYNNMSRGDDFYLSGWVRTDKGYDVSGLTGLSFGVPWNIGKSGYQVVIDVRNGTDDKAAFQIRKNYWERLAVDNDLAVEANTWYRIEVFWDSAGKITGKLFSSKGTLISEVSAVDNTYVAGLYGVAANSNSSFDDLVAGRIRKPENDIVIGYTTEHALGDFHHVLFQAKENFSGDLKLMSFNKNSGFKNSGKLEFASVSDAKGSSYKLIKEVPFDAGQKEVDLYGISLEKGKYYVLGHSNGYYRFPTKERPSGKYMDILKSGYIRREIGTDLYDRTYGYGEYVFTPATARGYRIAPPIDLSFLNVAVDSKIYWDSMVPEGSMITVEASLDGKKWSKALNGSFLPVFVPGNSLEGKKLFIRQTLETDCDYTGPYLRSINIELTGAMEGCGVFKTQYRIGETGEWKDYCEVLKIAEEGVTDVYARSIDFLGNIGNEAVAAVKIDRSPPSIVLDMIKSDGNVYSSGTRTPLDVTVSPFIINSKSGLTVDSLYYSLNNSLWESYVDPLVFSGEGLYKLYFMGTDTVGNVIKVQEVIRIGDPGPGDVNGDGEIDVNDAISVLRYLVGTIELGEDELMRARVNCMESGPTVSDAILILRFVVGMVSVFPAETSI